MSRDDPHDRSGGAEALARGFAWAAARLRGEAPEPPPPPPALADMAASFGLTAFERDLLLLLAGCELDGSVAAAAAARPDHAGGGASVSTALAALPAAHWDAFGQEAALRRWRLIDLDEAAPLLLARLRIDERVLHALLGFPALDRRLAGLVRPEPAADTPPAPSHAAIAAALAAAARRAARPALIGLSGEDGEGRDDVAALLAAERGTGLLTIATDLLPAGAAEGDALAVLIAREALLRGALPLLRAADAMPAPGLRLADALAAMGLSAILSSAEPATPDAPLLRAEVMRPPAAERLALWRRALAGAEDSERTALAATYRVGARTIAAAGAAHAGDAAAAEAGLRLVGRARLSALAPFAPNRATLKDLVLPPAETATLEALVAQMRVRRAMRLGTEDGRGEGIAALFWGESGTGKTRAAEAVAGELGLDLHRVDLARTVSKYIGETEKHLARLFDAAEASGAVLLFDEADALFGKRSEVKDSHDRYANIEVGYLLQRLETYAGLAILTTNLRHALDPAFARRLRFVVGFPFPDHAARARLWARAFPRGAEREELDPAVLARLAVPGGAIRAIATNASFAAAAEGAPVAMRHLLAAARAEAAKRERPIAQAELKGWE